MKTIIHVNQHIIRRNLKTGEREPVITCKNYKENRYGHEVIVYDTLGNVVVKVVYSPDKPLSCGARVWVETENKVEVINHGYEIDKTCCSRSDDERRSESSGICRRNNDTKRCRTKKERHETETACDLG